MRLYRRVRLRPVPFETRIVTRFLWFPKTIGCETRWLETATWEEEWIPNRIESGYEPIRFVPLWRTVTDSERTAMFDRYDTGSVRSVGTLYAASYRIDGVTVEIPIRFGTIGHAQIAAYAAWTDAKAKRRIAERKHF